MNKDYLSIIILFCVKSLKGERSLSAIYYMLKGKKTSQTIQDGKLYKLSFLFQLFPHLTKNVLDQKANELEHIRLIEKVNNNTYFITEEGEKVLHLHMQNYPFPSTLDGWQYHSISQLFWERLSLIVQTLSNLNHSNHRFTPISKNAATIQWVKNFLLSQKGKRQHLAEKIHQELSSFLSKHTEKEATLFTLRLTSYKRVGLTFSQISFLIGEDTARVHVLFYGILHDLIKQSLTNQSKYSFIYALLTDIHQTFPLTFSTRKTYQLFVQGKSIEEIARIRQLKVSTIEDHIVELAHNLDGFSIESFIDDSVQKEIEHKINFLKTNQLKEIRQALQNRVSYFQIRLVLAKCGERNAT